MSIDLRVDAFSTLMILLISGIGTLVFFYAWHYFGTSPNSGRAAGLLTLFSGAMLGIVLGRICRDSSPVGAPMTWRCGGGVDAVLGGLRRPGRGVPRRGPGR